MAESPSRMPLPPLLIGVGGALLTISGRNQALNDLFPFPTVFQGFLYAGLAVDCFAFAWLLKIFVPWHLVRKSIGVEDKPEPMCLFEAGYAEEPELPELRSFFQKEFGVAPP